MIIAHAVNDYGMILMIIAMCITWLLKYALHDCCNMHYIIIAICTTLLLQYVLHDYCNMHEMVMQSELCTVHLRNSA